MESTQAPTNIEAQRSDSQIILRNTTYLGVAEVLSLPMSVFLNAMIGRYLGPEDVGHVYLATTISSLAFLAIGWGHFGSLPAEVARDRTRAGALLGTSLVWRVAASFVVGALVFIGAYALNLGERQLWALGLMFVFGTFSTILSACQDVIRGFERMDVAAYSRVALQLVTVALVATVLLLGGRMRLTIATQALSVLVVLVPLLRSVGRVGIGKIAWNRELFKTLMVGGTPFVFFSLALVVQPSVDAFYLAHLSTSEVVGWYAVEQRLVGFLLMPAITLIGALYPTLCRLWVTDQDAFKRTTRRSIRTITLLVVPVALGCALFPDIGVSIFGRASFGPAESILRVASFYLFLVYFTMPIGTALVAAGRQNAWTVVQLLCVINSTLLDPFLVDYFQEHRGNGAIGLAVASGISETFMVGAGLWMMPAGVIERGLLKTLFLSGVAGLAMAGTALGSLRYLPSLVSAPIAVAVYGVVLYATGALEKEELAKLTHFIARKLNRQKSAEPVDE